MQAAIAATRAEQARLAHHTAEIQSQTEHTRAKLDALNAASELDALRLRLGEASAQLNAALTALARTVPPGTVGVPAAGLTGEAVFDAVTTKESCKLFGLVSFFILHQILQYFLLLVHMRILKYRAIPFG